MSDELPANKKDARRTIRAARRSRRSAAGDEQWQGYGEDLGRGLTRWLEGRTPPALAAIYESLPNEPPTQGIQAALAAIGTRLIAPTLLSDNDLSWREPIPDGDAEVEPGVDLGVDAIARADLILVPGLAVGRTSGIRLGQGGGSYDRALARKRPGAPVIAVLFDEEVIDAVPCETHDRAVDFVLTPSGGVAEVGCAI